LQKNQKNGVFFVFEKKMAKGVEQSPVLPKPQCKLNISNQLSSFSFLFSFFLFFFSSFSFFVITFLKKCLFRIFWRKACYTSGSEFALWKNGLLSVPVGDRNINIT